MHMLFPVIDPVATGENILRLRKARGLTVRDLQNWFGFEEPQAIYKWQKGKSLPTVDNLYALGALFNVPMEEILVPRKVQLNISGQQDNTCCPPAFLPGCFECGRTAATHDPFISSAFLAA
jgi:transcriptional regulator with XRE-family HTH domain